MSFMQLRSHMDRCLETALQLPLSCVPISGSSNPHT